MATKLTKSGILNDIAESTELTRKQVNSVFEGLTEVIRREMSKKGSGEVNVLGLFKVRRIHKPAQKGGQKRPNPFKPGEMMVTKAKPAHNVIKVRPLKNLKDMV